MGGFTSLNLAGLRFEAPDPEAAPARGPEKSQAKSGPQPPPEKKEEKPDERMGAMERELSDLRASNRELVALVGRQAPAKPPDNRPADEDFAIDWGKDEDEDEEEAPEDPEDPATLVEDLTKLGRDALAKRGFVRKADVVKLVRQESRRAARTAATQVVRHARSEVATESAVMREYPELADQNSELHKTTAAHLREAVGMGAPPNAVTLRLAAARAKAELGAADLEDDDREPVDRKPNQRTERDIHIAAQNGDHRRQSRRVTNANDADFRMNDDAREVARGMGISDDDFKKEAKRVQTIAGGRRG